MADLTWFKAGEYEETVGFQPLPAGDYQIIIIASEKVLTKRGDGERLNLTLEVTDGKYKGRKLYDGLNIRNPNETAQEIGIAHLSNICRCVGVITPRDSSELHNRKFYCSVIVKQSMNGGDRNTVKSYFQRWTEPHAPKTAELKKPTKVAGPPEPKDDDIPF